MWLARRPLSALFVLRQFRLDVCSRRFLYQGLSSRKIGGGPTLLNLCEPQNCDIILEEDELTNYERRAKDEESLIAVKATKLAEVLGCKTEEMVLVLRTYPNISGKPLNRLLWTARLLKARYPVQSILKYPAVLNLSWRLMENRSRVYEEIGATNLEPVSALVLFEKITSLSLFELNRRKIISVSKVLPSILSKIEKCPPKLKKRLNNRFRAPAVATLPLVDYRSIIIQEYLSEVIGDISLSRQRFRRLEQQSMELLSVRVNILLDELGLDRQYIQSQPTLLLVNTHNLRDIVDSVDNLCDIPLRDVVSKNPKILALSAKRLCDVEKILRAQKFHRQHVAMLPQVYNIHPKLFKEHFEVKKNGEDADSEQPEAFMRMLHFQEVLRQISMLDRQNKKNKPADAEGRVSTDWQNPFEAVVEYLSLKLKISSAQKIKMRRSLSSHPWKRFLAHERCKKACEFLLNNKILSEAQISHNAIITLWAPDALRGAWEAFPVDAYKEALGPDWRSHPFLAEMLMYEMENDGMVAHFCSDADYRWTGAIKPVSIDDLHDDEDPLHQDEQKEKLGMAVELYAAPEGGEYAEGDALVPVPQDSLLMDVGLAEDDFDVEDYDCDDEEDVTAGHDRFDSLEVEELPNSLDSDLVELTPDETRPSLTSNDTEQRDNVEEPSTISSDHRSTS